MENSLDGSENPRWGYCRQDFTSQPCPHTPHIGLCPVCGKDWHSRTIRRSGIYSRSSGGWHPIPPNVLAQLDGLLRQAVQSMRDGQAPLMLSPMMWDAILILRCTGIRCSQLLSLQAPSQAGPQGCFERDENGFWWLLVKPKGMEIGENDRRVPIHPGSGVFEAFQRQYQRVIDVPDPLGDHPLFRHNKGLLNLAAIQNALRRLAAHLTHEGRPYVITIHQFRHTIVQDMFEHNGNLSILGAVLGHTYPSSTYYYMHLQRDALAEKFVLRLQQMFREFHQDEEQLSQEGEQLDGEREDENEDQDD